MSFFAVNHETFYRKNFNFSNKFSLITNTLRECWVKHEVASNIIFGLSVDNLIRNCNHCCFVKYVKLSKCSPHEETILKNKHLKPYPNMIYDLTWLYLDTNPIKWNVYVILEPFSVKKIIFFYFSYRLLTKPSERFGVSFWIKTWQQCSSKFLHLLALNISALSLENQRARQCKVN